VNNLALITCVEFFHLSKLFSIIIAGITYTTVFYLLSRYVVFTHVSDQKSL
jgi:putative flippase GtrA